jgi:hypothetical protein
MAEPLRLAVSRRSWLIGVGSSSDQLSSSVIVKARRANGAPAPTARQARVVCANCNSGWMSDLETRVSPLLVPDRLDGRLLSHDEQELLATLAVKTALVLSAAETPDRRVIPPKVARRFGSSVLLEPAPATAPRLSATDCGTGSRLDREHRASAAHRMGARTGTRRRLPDLDSTRGL